MAFVLPTFNLTCGIYTNIGAFGTKVHRLDSPCQLRGPQQGPRTGAQFDVAFDEGGSVPLLLLPPLTDIRDNTIPGNSFGDIVECPAASGRWYIVFYVEDIAKGFANEHRYAMLSKSLNALIQTTGMPLSPVPYP